MAINGKKEKQKNFRITEETAEKFESYYADVKGDSTLTKDELFELMLNRCIEQRFLDKHSGRADEIKCFVNALNRILDQYKASLAMVDSVKEETERQYKAELNEKATIISDLISERNNMKETIKAMEEQLETISEENTMLKEKNEALKVDLAAKDAVIKSNEANNEMAKNLAEIAANMTINSTAVEENNKNYEALTLNHPVSGNSVGTLQSLQIG